jgi:hypothetical protein
MTIEEYDGPRRGLRELFEFVEDSGQVLDAYIADGRVLVAFDSDEPIGHVQLIDTEGQARPGGAGARVPRPAGQGR